MIGDRIYRFLALGTLASLSVATYSPIAAAQVDLSEDRLNTEKSLQWGGRGLPFDSVVTLRDTLVNSIVGKVVIDRHGEDSSRGLFSSPFAGPNPGRMTIVTLWGAKEEGCFVKTLVHVAPKNTLNLRALVPTQLEIGLGSQIVKLSPSPKTKPKGASGRYTYTEYVNKSNIKRTATQYFTENTFAVNARVADLFRNAPVGDAKVRLTFAGGNTQVFPIGRKNVSQWRDSYGYNPSCQSRN